MATKTIKITLKKSLISCTKAQIATAQALGLRKVGDVSEQPDNAQTAGKITKIKHLLDVTQA